MSNTKRRFERARKKQSRAARKTIEQMIEAGYFVLPPKGDLEQGKTYVAQVTHDHGCPFPDGGGTCTCPEIQVECLKYLAEGKVDA